MLAALSISERRRGRELDSMQGEVRGQALTVGVNTGEAIILARAHGGVAAHATVIDQLCDIRERYSPVRCGEGRLPTGMWLSSLRGHGWVRSRTPNVTLWCGCTVRWRQCRHLRNTRSADCACRWSDGGRNWWR